MTRGTTATEMKHLKVRKVLQERVLREAQQRADELDKAIDTLEHSELKPYDIPPRKGWFIDPAANYRWNYNGGKLSLKEYEDLHRKGYKPQIRESEFMKVNGFTHGVTDGVTVTDYCGRSYDDFIVPEMEVKIVFMWLEDFNGNLSGYANHLKICENRLMDIVDGIRTEEIIGWHG